MTQLSIKQINKVIFSRDGRFAQTISFTNYNLTMPSQIRKSCLNSTQIIPTPSTYEKRCLRLMVKPTFVFSQNISNIFYSISYEPFKWIIVSYASLELLCYVKCRFLIQLFQNVIELLRITVKLFQQDVLKSHSIRFWSQRHSLFYTSLKPMS